jgi:PncC family amidohydrolase
MHEDVAEKVKPIGDRLIERGLTLAVMESCTGGMLATGITCTPGCGDYFLGGIVSYATESKLRFGVDDAVVREHGVVSAETASEMARAAVRELEADIGIGVTGVAGPDSQDGMPVGCVFIALTFGGRVETRRFDFGAVDPDEVKRLAVFEAVGMLGKVTEGSSE